MATTSTAASTKKQNDDLLKNIQNQVILKEHNAENLHAFLLLCNPGMTRDHINHDSQRIAAMKNVMVAIHPSKYPYNEDVQYIFEDVQRFYDLCCQSMTDDDVKGGLLKSVRKRRRRRPISPTSVVEQVVQCKLMF